MNDKVKLNKIKQEAAILSNFNHPHIMRVYELVESADGVFIVMEYLPGGELYDLILKKQKFTEDEARKIFQQLICAIEYCHSHGVVHRDIKPENILLDDQENIKLGDFGLATYCLDGRFLYTSCGSVNYAAPEIVSGKPYSGPEVDIWSIGVVLFTLVSGYLPFDEGNISVLFAKIKKAEYEMPGFLSEDCQDLIYRMLELSPVNRIQIYQIKKHPWFTVNVPNHLNYGLLSVEQNKNIRSITEFKNKSHPILDEEIFERCVANPRLIDDSYDQEKLKKRLLKKKQDAFCVCYRILNDSKRKQKMKEFNQLTIDINPIFNKLSDELKPVPELRKSFSLSEEGSDVNCLLMPHNWTYGFRTKLPLKRALERLLAGCSKLNFVFFI